MLALHGHKIFGNRIILRFKVAGKYPNFTPVFSPNLGGAQYVPRRVKRKGNTTDMDRLTIGNRLHLSIRQPIFNNRFGGMGAQILLMTPARVIGMPMTNQRPFDRPPGVKVYICTLTIDTVRIYRK